MPHEITAPGYPPRTDREWFDWLAAEHKRIVQLAKEWGDQGRPHSEGRHLWGACWKLDLAILPIYQRLRDADSDARG